MYRIDSATVCALRAVHVALGFGIAVFAQALSRSGIVPGRNHSIPDKSRICAVTPDLAARYNLPPRPRGEERARASAIKNSVVEKWRCSARRSRRFRFGLLGGTARRRPDWDRADRCCFGCARRAANAGRGRVVAPQGRRAHRPAFPDSGLPVRSRLWLVETGFMHVRPLADGGSIGGNFLLRSASDQGTNFLSGRTDFVAFDPGLGLSLQLLWRR
jgi:hypothetical protein